MKTALLGLFATLSLAHAYGVVPGGASGDGSSTRYWDCCKASCSWPDNADVSAPVSARAKDDTTLVDVNEQSGCGDGGAFMCSYNQPFAQESDWCCGCYELTFSEGVVKGKKMVVQVTNTGGDLSGRHFDILMPSGGAGIFNDCQTQWGAPADGGVSCNYGGISSAEECIDLLSALQDGCNRRFECIGNDGNPTHTFKEVTCPAELTEKTGCSRN